MLYSRLDFFTKIGAMARKAGPRSITLFVLESAYDKQISKKITNIAGNRPATDLLDGNGTHLPGESTGSIGKRSSKRVDPGNEYTACFLRFAPAY